MRLELAWGDGISVVIDMPKKISGEKFLEIVEELEFLIKRGKDSKRMKELEEEFTRMSQKQVQPRTKPSVSREDALLKEFLTWKKQEHPPLPIPATQAPQPYPAMISQPPVPQQYWQLPYSPVQPDGLSERLAKLEEHTSKIIDFLDELSQR